MSGGVDSSVTALLLKQSYPKAEIVGIHMQIKDTDPEIETVKSLCNFLNIPYKIIDLRESFAKLVKGYFLKALINGETPNPCVVCNKTVKFGMLFDYAISDRADYFATGHYAITQNGELYKAKDKKKDQSYFLSFLSGNVLKQVIFPLGNYYKTEVREIAKQYCLPMFNKPDSQEICFIKSYPKFLRANISQKLGKIIEFETNNVVGEHNGVWFYTIGQRKGIKIGGLPSPYYVVAKNTKNNSLIVSKNAQMLYGKPVNLVDFNFVNEKYKGKITQLKNLTIKVRSQSKEIAVNNILFSRNTLTITTKKPIFAATSGQIGVLYCKDKVIGGGIISNTTIDGR